MTDVPSSKICKKVKGCDMKTAAVTEYVNNPSDLDHVSITQLTGLLLIQTTLVAFSQ